MAKIPDIFLVIALFLSQAITAQEVSIVSGPVLGIINQEGNGPYQQIIHQAAKRSGITLNENIYPLKRAIASFKHKKALAIYLMIDAFEGEARQNKIITTYPIGIHKLHIFTRKNTAAISSYAQLKGKQVGGIFGYEASYQPLLEQNIDLYYISNEKVQLNKLLNGRLDAIVGFLPDWQPYLAQLNYDKDFVVTTGYDYIIVWNTPEGRAFVNTISPALQQMNHDGTLKKILAQRYLPFTYHPSKPYQWQNDKTKAGEK